MKSAFKSAFSTLIAVVALVFALPVWAHHSYAMFDRDKKITLTGTVKEFQWNNPHCFIQVLVPSQDASQTGTVEWSVEMGAPAQLVRSGWKSSTVKPGDRVSVVIFPLRDGTNGGGYVSASWPDGKAIGN